MAMMSNEVLLGFFSDMRRIGTFEDYW